MHQHKASLAVKWQPDNNNRNIIRSLCEKMSSFHSEREMKTKNPKLLWSVALVENVLPRIFHLFRLTECNHVISFWWFRFRWMKWLRNIVTWNRFDRQKHTRTHSHMSCRPHQRPAIAVEKRKNYISNPLERKKFWCENCIDANAHATKHRKYIENHSHWKGSAGFIFLSVRVYRDVVSMRRLHLHDEWRVMLSAA